MNLSFILAGVASFIFLFLKPAPACAQAYDVLPPMPSVRGQIWFGMGPTLVLGENRSVGNRLRLGVDYQFGQELRFQLGWTIIDEIYSGEKSASVGNVSRGGSGPNLGYFVIPEKLCLTYTYLIEAVSGGRVSDDVTTSGHQLSLSYRFYANDTLHLGAHISYLYMPSVMVPIYDLPSQTYTSATYPSAQVWSLGLTVGAYFF